MKLEVENYMHLLDGLELTREEKEEVILTIISFTESRLDKAYGIHPVQMARQQKQQRKRRRARTKR